jgi:2-oxo-3-hexenedioate decarboxylase
MLSPAAIASLAKRVDDAFMHVAPIDKLTIDTPFDVDDGYRIQRASMALRTARGDGRVGMKMGLTSRPKMEQMGVKEPIYGTLTQAMILEDGGTLSRAAHCHPRVEPEVAFVLRKPLRGIVTPVMALDAIDGVCAALEVIDSRFRNFSFTLADVIADNGSSARFVLSTMVKPSSVETGNLGMVMRKNGVIAEVGSSAAVLDHPLRSLIALCAQLALVDDFLAAGDIVLTGGATAAIPVDAGDWISVDVQDLGRAELFVVA